MQLTNRQILDAQPALGKLLNTSLPVKQAYRIKKTLESIKKQALFVDDQRKDLIKEYGGEKEDGNYEIPVEAKESRDKFFKAYEEILDMQEDIDVRKLTLEDLEHIEITANELDTIEFIIDTTEA